MRGRKIAVGRFVLLYQWVPLAMATWFRTFSLRTMFVVVTAVCVFIGYHLNWARQRRAILEENMTTFVAEWSQYYDFRLVKADLVALGATTWRSRKELFYSGQEGGPGLLWLFNEKGVSLLRVAVPESAVTMNENGEYTISRSYPSIERATRRSFKIA